MSCLNILRGSLIFKPIENFSSDSFSIESYHQFAKPALKIALCLHFVFLLFFLGTALFPLVILNVFSILIYVLTYALIASKVSDAVRFNLGTFCAVVQITGHSFFASYYLGWQVGFSWYYLFAIPIVAINVHSTLRLRFVQILFLVILYVLIDAKFFDYQPLLKIQHAWVVAFRLFNLLACFVTAALLIYVRSRAAETVRQTLYQLANTDSLTGIKNRRYITEAANYEMVRQGRSFESLSFLMADIDSFKRVNDIFGHEVGDQVLVEFAKRLAKGLRQQDVLARWGGEEFLVMLPNANIDFAVEVAERLRLIVNESHFSMTDLAITATFGVCQYKANETFDDAVARADRAMYQGKEHGRNQVWQA